MRAQRDTYANLNNGVLHLANQGVTKAGRSWFSYFRLYSPEKAFLDHSWVLPDIEQSQISSTGSAKRRAVKDKCHSLLKIFIR